MAFSTTSYLAGVGSVVVILSTGFAGGYMVANPTRPEAPNRLQRLAAEARDTRPVATPPATPEIVATAAATPTPAPETPPPAVTAQAAPPAPIPVKAKTAEPPAGAVSANADQAGTEKVTAEKPNVERPRLARSAERKRAEDRRFAERQRKQRELEVATVAVRQLMHRRYRDDEEFAAMDRPERPEMPRLMFGEE